MFINTTQQNGSSFININKKIVDLLGPVDNSIINIIFESHYLSKKF